MKFIKTTDSHTHSLQTLNQLYEYDDFMFSIKTVIDLGCGPGDDLEWWATRTTRDESQTPLEIQCTGVDLFDRLNLCKKYANVSYQQTDFEGSIKTPEQGFDILWCHDSFQYATTPLQTLKQWYDIAARGGMLAICVPITQRIYQRQLDYFSPTGNYFHYSLVNLIYMLATTGWDCRNGFFKLDQEGGWIHAVVYKSDRQPQDPQKTNWYTLSEQQLLPRSTDDSIQAHGYLRQQDLIITWLDQSKTSLVVR
jgi:ubiquinone/menaquinone biosynthesis C-methylase UbiE